ncbi:MAG: hypothetical protein MJ016_04915 [Victivallaceae bacterium]|nr:hypothetical protein [Victivallaceae bacterium]
MTGYRFSAAVFAAAFLTFAGCGKASNISKEKAYPPEIETRRVALSGSYERDKKILSSRLNDATVQMEMTVAADDIAELEEKYFLQISAWRRDAVATPQARALLEQELREVAYRRAVYDAGIRYDELSSRQWGGEGSAAPMIDRIKYAEIFSRFNHLSLLPENEAEREREKAAYPVVFTEHGEKFRILPGMNATTMLPFINDEKFPFYMENRLDFTFGGKEYAVYCLYPDCMSSSGSFTLLTGLQDGEWREIRRFPYIVYSAKLENGELLLESNRSTSYVPLDFLK